MKNIIIIALLISCCFVYANDELRELQSILAATRGSWTAAENEFSMLPVEQQKKMMGLLPGVYNPNGMPEPMLLPEVREDRVEVDHTSIKDQESCGSCYSFGACATYEAYWMKNNRNATPVNRAGDLVDLSEQWFMMKAKALDTEGAGGCNGWYLDTSMDLLLNHGVANEKDCPYLGYESECTSGSAVHKIGQWDSTGDNITDLNKIKSQVQSAVVNYGMVYVGFAVYSDFSYYSTGYYAYSSGYLRGYHAVAIVGYDDTGFKVKNSWGTGWGESGYFRIKYSQMTNSVKFGNCFGGSFWITK